MNSREAPPGAMHHLGRYGMVPLVALLADIPSAAGMPSCELGSLEITKSKLRTSTLREFAYGFDLVGNRVAGSYDVLSRQGFDPFGAQVSGSSTGLGHRGSSGARTDTETGYVGTGASPYDPATATYPTAGLAAPGASPYAGGAGALEGATSPTDLLDALADAQAMLNAAPTSPGMGAAYGQQIDAASPQAKQSACSGSDAGFFEDLESGIVGAFDGYTGGVTADVRQLIGIDNVDYCSPYYVGLSAAGEVAGWLPGPGTTLRVGVKVSSMVRWGRIGKLGLADDALALAAKGADDLVDLSSAARRRHVVYGDKTGGGHLYPGRAGKTPFPRDWDGDRIMHEISDIATDPASQVLRQSGGRTVLQGTRGGISIRVVTDGSDIVTGYPTNLPRNP